MKKSKILIAGILLLFTIIFSCTTGTKKVYAESSKHSNEIQNAQNGVVRVYCEFSNGNGSLGSAFAVSKSREDGEDKYTFITNRHVVTDDSGNVADKVYIFNTDDVISQSYDMYYMVDSNNNILDQEQDNSDLKPDYSKLVDCDVLYCSPTDSPDFAIIQPTESIDNCTILSLLSSDEAEVGESVYALGFPSSSDVTAVKSDWEYYGQSTTGYPVYKEHFEQDINGSKKEQTLTSGVVSKLTTYASQNNVEIIQHTAQIRSGNSGGPLINEDGAVIGINTYGYGKDSADENNAAIYIDYVMEELDNQHIKYTVYGESDNDEDKDKSGFPFWIIPVILLIIFIITVVVLLFTISGKKKASKNKVQKKPENIVNSGQNMVHLPDPVVCSFSPQHNKACYSVSNQKIIAGRDVSVCTIIYQNGTPGVSRKHCSIGFDPNRRCFLVTDLNSTNGTWFANGTRMEPGVEYQLKPNDIFYLGDGKFGNVLQVELR